MTIACYIKKRKGLCVKEKLQALDKAIAEKKAFYQTLVKEIEKVEKMIKERQYHKLWTFVMPLYDGFNYEEVTVQEREEHVQKEKNCPYRDEPCEALLAYKEETLIYQNNKVMKLLESYNQLACLLFALQHYDKKKYCIKEQMFLSLDNKPDFKLSYYATDHFRCEADSIEPLYLFYTAPTMQVIIKEVPLFYKTGNTVMVGTSLKTTNTSELWIELPISYLQEPIKETVLKTVQEVILFLRRHGKKVVGSFISLKDVEPKEKEKLILQVKALGYYPIGKVIHQHFIENQLLIWQVTSKNR